MKADRKDPRVFAFEKEVANTVFDYSMIKDGDSILVGLSGGADSVSLLLALKSLSENPKMPRFSVFACHVNHCIRGDEADRDMDFSENLTKRLGIPFFSTRINIPELCRSQKGTTEEIARNCRYGYFSELCEKHGFTKIATAHTLSDNAETLLFDLCRGNTLQGLCGIPPVRGNIIRPLIRQSRSSVEEYLGVLGQEYVTDSTNLSDDYTRNYFRNAVIPLFKNKNPAFEKDVFRITSELADSREYFENEAEKILSNPLSVETLCGLPHSLASAVLRKLYRKSFKENCSLPQNISDSIIDTAKKSFSDRVSTQEKSFSLPGNKLAHIRGGIISFSEKPSRPDISACRFNMPLHEGINILNKNFAVIISRGENAVIPESISSENKNIITNEEIVYKLYKNVHCTSAIIIDSLSARSRNSGDSVKIDGMSRNIKKAYTDFRIPNEMRNDIPVICDSEGVLYVPCFKVPRDSANDSKLADSSDKERLWISVYKNISKE